MIFLSLVGELFAQQPVRKGSEHGCSKEYNENRIPTAQQYEHRPGANAGECPAQPENEPTDQVAGYALVFRVENDLLAFRRLQMCALDHLHDTDSCDDSREDDAVHVERLEVEHLEYPEPGNGFRLIQRDPQQDAYEDIF